MEKVDFCFLFQETFNDARHAVLISKELKQLGYSSFFITTSRAGDMIFKEAGLSNFKNIDELIQKTKLNDNELESRIIELEKKYGIESIRAELLTQKYVFAEKNEELLIKRLIQYLLALEKFFNEELKTEYFVQGLGGVMHGIAFYYIGRTRGKHIFFVPSPFKNINFSFHPWGILEIDQAEKVSETDKKFILDYINKMKAEKKLTLFLTLERANPIITKERMKRFFYLLRGYGAQKLSVFYLIKNFWKRFFRQFFVRRFYTEPNFAEKYIFFPLHYPYDSQLIIRAIPFLSQEFLVEILSRYLPYGYKLYVKEHPAALGYFSVKMLEYISKLPNVILIPPETNPYDLNKNAAMVCVINSTAGFEALMYQKPVITFGSSFYRGKGITLDVENLYDIPKIINKAKDFKPNWDKILTLFSLWYKNSFPPASEKTMYCGDKEPEREDVKIFCQSLLKFLETNKYKDERL